MKVYSPPTNKGRIVSGQDVHHRTADQSRPQAKAAAKSLRHAARREGKPQPDDWEPSLYPLDPDDL